jgi:hypothetical protein
MIVFVIRGIGMCANDSRRPLPVGRHAHQPRVQAILHVAAEDAILDQHRALRRMAFVVDVERAAPPIDRAVVDHRNAGRGDALADAARERARPPCG